MCDVAPCNVALCMTVAAHVPARRDDILTVHMLIMANIENDNDNLRQPEGVANNRRSNNVMASGAIQ